MRYIFLMVHVTGNKDFAGDLWGTNDLFYNCGDEPISLCSISSIQYETTTTIVQNQNHGVRRKPYAERG